MGIRDGQLVVPDRDVRGRRRVRGLCGNGNTCRIEFVQNSMVNTERNSIEVHPSCRGRVFQGLGCVVNEGLVAGESFATERPCCETGFGLFGEFD